MSLEELFVDRDVLDRDDAAARLVLGDGVDEKRRIAETRGGRACEGDGGGQDEANRDIQVVRSSRVQSFSSGQRESLLAACSALPPRRLLTLAL